MKTFEVEVYWRTTVWVEVQAESADEAIDKVDLDNIEGEVTIHDPDIGDVRQASKRG